MYLWEKPEYTDNGAHVFDTPAEQKSFKVSRDSRSIREKLEDFEAKLKKEESLRIRV